MAETKPTAEVSSTAVTTPVGNLEMSRQENARYARIMHHRQMLRRGLILGIVVAALVAVGLVLVPAARQLAVQWSLGGAGIAVDWQLDGESWMTGGTTFAQSRGTQWKEPPLDAELLRLPELWNLQSLKLYETEFTEQGLAPLSQLTQLRELDLSRKNHIRYGYGPSGLSDACLVPIQNLSAMESLTLSGNRITDSGLALLAGLSNLEILDLEATDVTDAGLTHLRGLKKLRVLNLAGTLVTPEGVKSLKVFLPECHINLDLDPTMMEMVRNWRRRPNQ